MRTSGIIAIVWAPEEQRSESMARQLGAPLYRIHYLKYKRPLYAPFKYPLQWLRTWYILLKTRPHYVYVTNPPVLAALCVWFYCALSGAKLILDTHPPALFMRKWAWSVPLQRWVARRAFANITDQDRFKRLFESWGAPHLTVLERPPKDIHQISLSRQANPNTFEIAVINTFAEDEPLQCVLDAARLMPEVTFYITGDTSKGNRKQIEHAPPNCIFTGYLLGDHYWNLLNASRAVMALTEWKNSLIMAGQDGITMHKPVIMSRQETTVEYFYKGTVFVDNTGASIAEGIRAVQRRERELIRQTYEFLDERQQQWDASFYELKSLLNLNPGSA